MAPPVLAFRIRQALEGTSMGPVAGVPRPAAADTGRVAPCSWRPVCVHAVSFGNDWQVHYAAPSRKACHCFVRRRRSEDGETRGSESESGKPNLARSSSSVEGCRELKSAGSQCWR